jgi:hypothetical protein
VGGYRTEGDNARVTLVYTDGVGNDLLTVQLNGRAAAERGNATKLLPRRATGVVPAGARAAYVTLAMTRVFGVYNDGFADSLSLVLSLPTMLRLPAVLR